MKIAFFSIQNLRDINIWSGIPFFLGKYLNQKVKLEYIDNFSPLAYFDLLEISKRIFFNRIMNYKLGVYKYKTNYRYLNKICRIAKKKLEQFKPDYILCSTPYEIAYLETEIPIIIWTDATYILLKQYYTDYKRYCNLSKRDIFVAEKIALEKAKYIIYSSSWAAESAIKDYSIDRNKIHILPFGANLNLEIINSRTNYQEKNFDKCQLLFIGQDTERKGLDKAIKVTNKLNDLGLASHLTIVGSERENQSDYLTYLGKISKDSENSQKKIIDQFNKSHFFILPSFAEAFGVVFSEASACSVPSISHNICGIPSAIKDGINGKLFNINSTPEEMAIYIKNLFEDKSKYFEMCEKSRKEYEDKLSWEVSIEKLLGYLQ